MCEADLCPLGRTLLTRWDTIVQTLFKHYIFDYIVNFSQVSRNETEKAVERK